MARDLDAIIKIIFANAGDVGLGGLDLNELWPISYSTPGGPFPQRIQFNQLLRWLSALAVEINAKGPFLEWDGTDPEGPDYEPGSVVTGSDGLRYLCAVANGPDSTIVNPVGDVTGTWQNEGLKPAFNIITASGTYDKPDGLKFIIAIAQGAGAGAGGVDGQGAGTWAVAQSASSGDAVISIILASDLLASETVTIGAKGTGGLGSGGSAGTDGGTTLLGALLQALGGLAGNGSTANNVATTRPGADPPGPGSVGDIVFPGKPGGISVDLESGASQVTSGPGASSLLSSGANSQTSDNNGIDADGFGGGGSGATVGDIVTNFIGGDGSDGVLIILEFF